MKTAVLLASLVVAGSSSAWAAKAYTLRQLFDDPPNQSALNNARNPHECWLCGRLPMVEFAGLRPNGY
jgi:hypothetical protein